MLFPRDEDSPVASNADADAILMPVLLGCCLHLIIFGVLLTHYTSYLQSSWSTTSRLLKTIVTLVMLLTALSAGLQIADIVHFGTLQQRSDFALMKGTFSETTETIWVGMVGFLVQGVLVVRAARVIARDLYRLIFVVIVGSLSLLGFLGSIGMTVWSVLYFKSPLMQPTTTPNLNQCAGIWLGSSAGADLIISATFIVLLRNRLLGSGEHSDFIVLKVCRLALRSALFTTCFAVPGAILCLCFSPNVIKTLDVYFPFFLPLPSLYALSLFTTLNIRQTVRTPPETTKVSGTRSSSMETGGRKFRRNKTARSMTMTSIQLPLSGRSSERRGSERRGSEKRTLADLVSVQVDTWIDEERASAEDHEMGKEEHGLGLEPFTSGVDSPGTPQIEMGSPGMSRPASVYLCPTCPA
ncbi:hypothetical protein MNV49_002207 [Pseudohyphozyma bogoriensis]|nr:hypothetical protein MNV49_002206 [Pseudohyphozyma bogoriensis]KAI5479917.1 hypothetical protein MNV49_002207 [Pseudohyphozyma bogoriensis]